MAKKKAKREVTTQDMTRLGKMLAVASREAEYAAAGIRYIEANGLMRLRRKYTRR